MSASDDEEKCDRGKEGDVVGPDKGCQRGVEEIARDRHIGGNGRKSRNSLGA